MINYYLYGTGALMLLALLALKRFYFKEDLLRRYGLLADGILFAGCLLLLGFYFYEKRNRIGVLATGMGGIAIGKYLYDKRKADEREEN